METTILWPKALQRTSARLGGRAVRIIQEPLLELDSCPACAVVWFDSPTCDSVPQLTNETTNSIPMQATEIIALNRLKELKEREEQERKRAKEKKALASGFWGSVR